MLGLGCGCNCGMGEIADMNGLGSIGLGSDPNVLDLSGTLWTQQPNQFPNLAGQSTDVGGYSAGNTWSDVWKYGVTQGFNVFTSRYGGVQPGQFMQSGSNIAYRLPTGASSFNTFPTGIGVGAGSGSLLTYALIGGAALIAIKAFSK